jgi:hypothetical protein
MARRPGDASTPGEATPPQRISTPGLQRRNSNATLNGNVMPPNGPVASPEETRGPRFSSGEDVQRWLAGKPLEWATAMAVRAALRCIPAIAGNDESDVLTALRVASGAWLAVTTDDRAWRFLPDVVALPARDTVRPAVVQLFNSASDHDAVWTIIQSVAVAVQIARANTAAIDVWRVLEGDARALERGRSASDVARDPLWPGNFPTWLVRAWTDLKHQLLLLNADWEVWTTWYAARLIGGADINKIDIERVMIAEEIWQQGPRAVNAEIARLIGKHSRESTETAQPAVYDDFAFWKLVVINGPNLPMANWADTIAVLEQGSHTDRVQAKRLSAALYAPNEDGRVATYYTVFITASGEPRRRLISPALASSRPEFTKILAAEQDRLIELMQTVPRPSSRADQLPVPTVPGQRPAAMEPVWKNGRLTLPNNPAKVNLSKKKFAAALTALRDEVLDFSQVIAGEAIIDRRFVSFVQDLAARIPDKPPPQDELFRLGHIEEILARYAKVANDEWPEFLAARYHALALQFHRTMKQAPSWREFKHNVAQQTLSSEQIAAARPLAGEAARALRDQDFVDPAVPESLEQLADAVQNAEDEGRLDVIEAGEEQLAADLIESVSNVLKRLAEVALPLAAAASTRAGSIASKAGKALVDSFEEGVVAGAKRVGKTCGYGLVTWLSGHGFIKLLIAQYPDAFE